MNTASLLYFLKLVMSMVEVMQQHFLNVGIKSGLVEILHCLSLWLKRFKLTVMSALHQTRRRENAAPPNFLL
jgi:hypothetical protein